MEGKKEQEDATGENGGRDTMDAVKYLREFARMCAEYSICKGCQIGHGTCRTMEAQEPEKIVDIVAEWAKEHPVETRQSVFLERYPNAKIDEDGVLNICPDYIEGSCRKYEGVGCNGCRRKYWSEEIHDE